MEIGIFETTIEIYVPVRVSFNADEAGPCDIDYTVDDITIMKAAEEAAREKVREIQEEEKTYAALQNAEFRRAI